MKSIQEVFAYLVSAYPVANVSPASFAVYAEALSDIPVERLAEVAREHVRASPFFPAVADLRKRVMLAQLPPGAELNGEAAWAMVSSWMPSSYDQGDGYAEANKAIGAFLYGCLGAIGGWKRLQEDSAERCRRAFIGVFNAEKDLLMSAQAQSFQPQTLLPGGEDARQLSDSE